MIMVMENYWAATHQFVARRCEDNAFRHIGARLLRYFLCAWLWKWSNLLYAEFLHTPAKGIDMHAKGRSGAVRATDLPVPGFQNTHDIITFQVFQRLKFGAQLIFGLREVDLKVPPQGGDTCTFNGMF